MTDKKHTDMRHVMRRVLGLEKSPSQLPKKSFRACIQELLRTVHGARR